MLKTFSEKDHVIIDLCGSRTEVLLSCDEALRFAEGLDTAAAEADLYFPKSLNRLQRWDCYIVSFDGKVALRFTPPSLGLPNRVPMPTAAARAIAERIRYEESFAEYRTRLSLNPIGV